MIISAAQALAMSNDATPAARVAAESTLSEMITKVAKSGRTSLDIFEFINSAVIFNGGCGTVPRGIKEEVVAGLANDGYRVVGKFIYWSNVGDI